MHLKNEISDRINTLFSLDGDEFDPKIHLPMAEFIVNKLGKEKTYIASLTDIFTFESPNIIIESESERVGEFVIRHLGRLAASKYLGLHPKIEIADWKSEAMKSSFQETEVLEIAYEKKRVLGLHKYARVEDEILFLGKLVVSRSVIDQQWIYRV